MTNADAIRKMTEDELVDVLYWGVMPHTIESIPDCSEGCEDETCGCGLGCPRDKRERNIRKWLKEEAAS